MSRLIAWWDRHWFPPASLRDLAVVRIVTAGSWLVLTALFDPLSEQIEAARADGSLYIPLPALKVLLLPLGWGARPSEELLTAVYVITFAAGVLALVGLYSRVSMLALALGNALLVAHEYSYGEIHHPEALTAIMLFALAFAPIGRELSVDALRRRRKQVRATGGVATSADGRDPLAFWPLRLGQWLLALAYLSAGASKLYHGGLAWMNGTTLTFYIAFDALAWDWPLGIWVAQFGWLLQILSIITVFWELFFWVAVLVPRTAWIFVLTGIGLHVGIYLTQGAPFFHFIALYIVFLPAIRDEWNRLRQRGRRSTVAVTDASAALGGQAAATPASR